LNKTGIKREVETHKRRALADRSTNIRAKAEVVDTDVGSCDDKDVNNNGIEVATNPGNLDSVGLEECRAQYASEGRAEKQVIVQVRGHQGPQVGSALYDFINPRGRFRCRRTMLMLFFGNDKMCESCDSCLSIDSHAACVETEDYKLCNTEHPTGCSRCAPKTAHICCDLCHPQFFIKYLAGFEKQSCSAAKSNMKPFNMSQPDHNLKAALVQWHRETALKELGPPSSKPTEPKFSFLIRSSSAWSSALMLLSWQEWTTS
jgi:hypothetical protein